MKGHKLDPLDSLWEGHATVSRDDVTTVSRDDVKIKNDPMTLVHINGVYRSMKLAGIPGSHKALLVAVEP